MSENLNASMGSLFVQLAAGQKPEYLGCTDLNAIAAPEGDVALTLCRDANGDFKTVGSASGVPGAVTTSLTALVFPEASILDRIRKGPVNVYALQRDCGQLGQFTNWVRGAIIHHARVTTRTLDNVVKREAADPTTLAVDLSGWHPLYQVRKVAVSRPDIAETTDLNALAMCGVESCVGNCGPAQEKYTNMFVGGVAPAGSPTERADIWATDDEGATWTNITGGAGHPFVSGQDIMAVACVQIDASTFRWFAVRAAVNSEPLKIAYSDDNGATWTLVTVGAINNEGATGAGAIFALDREHIWIATDAGNVYFSDDSGLTWTLQGSATASGGNALNAIVAADTDNVWAVGNSDTIILSTDGGDTWIAIVSPTSGANITALWAFSAFRAIVGTNADEMWQTWDGGVHWTAKSYVGQAGTGTVKFLSFANDLTGFMAHDTAAPVGDVQRTIDGGHTWSKLPTPANAGLNQIVAADENTAFAVGNAQAGTSVLFKVSG